jgi:hypothetical protein
MRPSANRTAPATKRAARPAATPTVILAPRRREQTARRYCLPCVRELPIARADPAADRTW